ncbi:MAG TPA: recombinase family protein, partial [Longimicrobiaceae bacterium]|nr:recombinase family protein [Longimicrobiaceae bacterium]
SIEVFTDFGISGASMDRPGVQKLIESIAANRLDTVVTESVDRLSRDVEDGARLRKLAKKHKVTLVFVSGSRVAPDDKNAPILFGIQNIFAEQYRAELAYKTKRGKDGVALKGLSNGGLPYGYDSDAEGRIQIDAEEAAVVRRIFEGVVAGASMTAMARRLNEESAPTPREGKPWTFSTIQVVLKCKKYTGRWDYADVVSMERPELAIVTPRLFAQASALFESRKGRSFTEARRAHLLSGILHCGVCGARMISAGGFRDDRYFGCSRFRSHGGCSNARKVRLSLIQEELLRALRGTLEASRGVIAALVAEELATWKSSRRPSERAKLAQEIRGGEKKLGNLIDAVATLGTSPALAEKIRAAEAHVAALKESLAVAETGPASLPSPEELLERVLRLEDLVTHGDVGVARSQLQALLKNEKVLAKPLAKGFQVSCDVVFDTREYVLAKSHVSKLSLPVRFMIPVRWRRVRG